MSLVVARITATSVFLVSDTKVSIDLRRKKPFVEGISKIVLINDDRCVAYAGVIENARLAISKLDVGLPSEELCSNLQKTCQVQNDVEFLVEEMKPVPGLWKVTGNGVKSSRAEWIGDFDGFFEFQRYFTGSADLNSVFDGSTRFEQLVARGPC